MFDRISHMEPLFPKAERAVLDLAMNVYRESAELGGVLNPITRNRISELLRHINSYYSNRIEGDHTNPVDIERAIRQQYSTDTAMRKLQELSVAHIEVQKLIDERLASNPELEVCSKEFLCWIHREFYRRVPESYLEISHPEKDEIITMVPGEIRKYNVKVGNHIAPVYTALDDFLNHFQKI